MDLQAPGELANGSPRKSSGGRKLPDSSKNRRPDGRDGGADTHVLFIWHSSATGFSRATAQCPKPGPRSR